MDYDLTTIPNAYDRSRDHGPEVLDLWMQVIALHASGRRVDTILDLGCGTGRFAESLATRFEACVVGVDPSEKMLTRARQKRRVAHIHYGRGAAEAIPLVDSAVDLIFMSMSFHHFTDPRRAARECRRVLRPQGTIVVRTGSREQIPSYPYVPFFPQTHSMLHELLPDHATLRDVFETAGFRCLDSARVVQTIAPTWAAYADKLAAGGDSVLARLSADELARGVEAVRRRAVEVDDRPVVEEIDVFFFR